MLNGRLKQVTLRVAIAALVVAMAAFPTLAHAEVVLDVYGDGYEPQNPVADNITRLKVNKLDKSDHEPVAGALLCIINEETGDVVDTWTSDGTTHEIARNVEGIGKDGALDIDTWYVLKELSVPEGYSNNFKELQDDPDTPHLIRFMIHSDDFNTTGEMEVDEEIAEFVDSEAIHGSGPEQAYVINLYNESVRYVEEEKERTRKSNATVEDEEETGTQTQKKNEKEKTTENKKTTTVERQANNSVPTTTTTQTQTQTITQVQTNRRNGTTTTERVATPKTGDATTYAVPLVLVLTGAALIILAPSNRQQT